LDDSYLWVTLVAYLVGAFYLARKITKGKEVREE
jgi:hypothetical protein